MISLPFSNNPPNIPRHIWRYIYFQKPPERGLVVISAPSYGQSSSWKVGFVKTEAILNDEKAQLELKQWVINYNQQTELIYTLFYSSVNGQFHKNGLISLSHVKRMINDRISV